MRMRFDVFEFDFRDVHSLNYKLQTDKLRISV
jgi:hypothetical protein